MHVEALVSRVCVQTSLSKITRSLGFSFLSLINGLPKNLSESGVSPELRGGSERHHTEHTSALWPGPHFQDGDLEHVKGLLRHFVACI